MLDIITNIKIAATCGFDAVAETIRKYDPIEIISSCSGLFNVSSEELAKRPMGGYSKKQRSGAYYFVLKDLKDNVNSYEWLYENLHDDLSRNIFSTLMLFRLCPDYNFIKSAYDPKNPQYFDKSIVNTDANEVFVDCGGYIGDSTLNYISHCGAYRHIYVYEPTSTNMEKCRKNLRNKPNITFRQAGVGLKNDLLSFEGKGGSGHFITNDNNSEKLNIISLDTDITEPVTFIKMDIEGAEIDAINGARQHISKDKPKLAICLYHIVSDMWEIPHLIHSINPDYNYYIRHYHPEQNWETVLYAIPK